MKEKQRTSLTHQFADRCFTWDDESLTRASDALRSTTQLLRRAMLEVF